MIETTSSSFHRRIAVELQDVCRSKLCRCVCGASKSYRSQKGRPWQELTFGLRKNALISGNSPSQFAQFLLRRCLDFGDGGREACPTQNGARRVKS